MSWLKAKKPTVYALYAIAGLFAFGLIFFAFRLFGAHDISTGAAAGSLYATPDPEVAAQLMPGFADLQNQKDASLANNGYGIFCDNIQLALLKSQEDAQWVLDSILSQHQVADTTASFVQNVGVRPSQGNVLGKEEALLVLQDGTANLLYIVQTADTVQSICTQFNMAEQDLRSLNASLGSSVLPGQLVSIKTEQKPLLKVKNVKVTTETKSIPYTTQTVSDSTLVKGQTATKQAGVTGVQTRTTTITYIDGAQVSSVTGDFITTKEPVPKIIRKGTKPPADAASAPKFQWPVSGPLSSPFGSRWGKVHEGIDIAVPTGTKVKAAAAGTVLRAFDNDGYGLFVEIDHGNGWISRYGHNSKLLVKKGDHVSAGQVISLSGSTGESTGPHVHFEVRKNGVPKDPLLYLP